MASFRIGDSVARYSDIETIKSWGKDYEDNARSTQGDGGPLGLFGFPVYNFRATFNTLRESNPELSEQAAAATAYFSMLAKSPMPTETGEIRVPKWDRELIDDGSALYLLGMDIVKKPGALVPDSVTLSAARNGVDLDLQTAYYYQLQKLQTYIARAGLGEGIEKTLKEQSRAAQQKQAQAQASKAAAAYAAAMAKQAAETVAESREEAAAAEYQAKLDYQAALEAEAEAQRELDNIANGFPAGYDPDAAAKKTAVMIAGGVAVVALIYFFGSEKKAGK